MCVYHKAKGVPTHRRNNDYAEVQVLITEILFGMRNDGDKERLWVTNQMQSIN